ncbi:MAG TPA: hypothetical protein VMG35_14330 [Bryobacteraceae bacterium]|nr:hypothetical protein [Bryobacteraceae bacterium]
MNKRPLSVTIIAGLYLATGGIGFIFHLIEFQPQHPFSYDIVWIELVHVMAIVSGVYILRGRNWARWLAFGWIAFHVIVSGFHSWFEMGVHMLLCAAIVYFLFRPRAAEYFRAA